MKRHGCLQAYILYIVLFIVFFIAIGWITALLFPNNQSNVLPIAAFLSIITVLVIKYRNSIRAKLHF
jgi:NADH:ubiquinone oxidoreductase subunit 3 (subunit A)